MKFEFTEFIRKLRSSSKFYSNSLTLVVRILELIQQGLIAARIADVLQMKKSHVSYYITKAKNQGFVAQITRDTFSVLQVTQSGKNLIDRYNNHNSSVPLCRAENIMFKAEIIQMPTIPVDWKKIEMNNWAQYSTTVDSVKVKLNNGNKPSVIFLPSPIEGDDPNDLIIKLVYECNEVGWKLFDKIGLRIGKLHMSSRGEWLVYDPLARAFCKYNGQVTYNGIGKVNASKPRRIGEFEFHDPRALQDYMIMPTRLKNIEDKIIKSDAKLDRLIRKFFTND